jgi:prepilin-type N-terminal cleavage/methylation domain-containing protein
MEASVLPAFVYTDWASHQGFFSVFNTHHHVRRFQMTLSTSQLRRGEQGFTLVELAIVMIIIGLLIGGILKGQELINNARVSSSVTQLKGMEAAINTFNDKYGARPGDIANPSVRLPNCPPAPAFCGTPGTGDGLIAYGVADVGAVVAASESDRAFVHLATSNLLSGSGVDLANAAAASAANYPDFNLTGKIVLGYYAGVGAVTGVSAAAGMPAGHYLMVGRGQAVSMAAGNVTIAANAAANIDRKMDDGQPNTGAVLSAGSAGAATTNCVDNTAATGNYNEGLGSQSCGLFVRILN